MILYVDVLDDAGLRVGRGPLNTVTSIATTRRLDAVGDAVFSVPASDPRTSIVASGAAFELWAQINPVKGPTYLGEYTYRRKQVMERSSGESVLSVECWDRLHGLTHRTVGLARSYSDQPVATIAADLLSIVGGWSVDDFTYGATHTISYSGESVLTAIDMLCVETGLHFRLAPPSSGSVLQIGDLSSDSGIRAVKMLGQVQANALQNDQLVMIEGVDLVDERDVIVNRIIPLGSGTGTTALTIEGATAGSLSVLSGVNQDGSLYYYVEDAASIAAYGVRERVVAFPGIRPIDNTESAVLAARNALKVAAEAKLAQVATPSVSYALQTTGLRRILLPGDTMDVDYSGVRDGYVYLEIDDTLSVTEIAQSWAIDGTTQQSLVVSNRLETPASDVEIIQGVVSSVQQSQTHPQPTLAYAPVGPYRQKLSGESGVIASFDVRVKEEITKLNRALLRFRTRPLVSAVTGMTVEDGTSGTHDHDLVYGIFEDPNYPRTISVIIDDLDITSEIGGPFASTNAAIDVEVDITDYLLESHLGWKAVHTIDFQALAGRGEIEIEVNMLVTIQPIEVSL